MGEDKKPDLNRAEQDYILAKVALNHYGVMHEYFVEQMKLYTVACSNISVGGTFRMVPAERLITYEIDTEKKKPLKRKKLLDRIMNAWIPNKIYQKERAIAALNLKTWTKALLSWDDATIRVVIDGTEQQ